MSALVIGSCHLMCSGGLTLAVAPADMTPGECQAVTRGICVTVCLFCVCSGVHGMCTIQ